MAAARSGRSQRSASGDVVCELLGLKGEVAADILEARDVYETALNTYFGGDFEGAAELFYRASRLRSGDFGGELMRDRSLALAADPPAAWGGIHVMHEK